MSDSADFELILVDGYTKEAKKAAKATRELERYMRSLQRQQEKDYRNRESALKMTHKSGAGFLTSARSAALLTSQVVALGVAAAAVGAVMFGREVAQRIEETESSVFALEKLTHNGAAAFGEMRDMAKELGLDIDDTAHSYANFLKLQFPQAEAKKLMALGADMQALGNSAEDVQGIFRALGQIKSKGRVQAEEMLQLAERGVSQSLVYEALAKNRGLDSGQKGVDQIRALQQAGKLGADEFMVAFEQAINKKLGQSQAGESAKDFVKDTFRGAKGAAEAEVTDLWIVASTAAQPGLKKGLEAFTDMIQTMSSDENMGRLERVMLGVGTAFELTGEILGYLVPRVIEAADVFGGGFADGYNNLGGSALTANGTLASTKELIDLLIPAARQFGEALGAIVAAFEWLDKHSPDMSTLGAGFKVATDLAGGNVGGAFGTLADAATYSTADLNKAPPILDENSLAARRAEEIDTMTDHGRNWGQGFITGMKGSEGGAYDAAYGMGAASEQGVRDALKIHSPSRVGEELGGHFVDGFEQPLNDAAPSMAIPTMSGGRSGSIGGSMSGLSIVIEKGAINVTGSGDPEQTAQATLRAFERNLGSTLSRMAMEAGAV